ncbi:hypothetical protein KSS87_022958 [Heliosperma pusillum]|nr:hypothetical protein KSS87_022958 [Heliosperma pusillum]
MALDIAILLNEEPVDITVDSFEAKKAHYQAWDRSNRLGLNLMRMTMADNSKPSMPKTEKAREFMPKVKECSQSDLADKSIVGSLMGELTTKRFDWSQPIHDHVTHMSNLAAKLKTLGMDEEGRLKKMKDQAVHFLSHDGAISSKGKPSKKGKKG